MVQAEARSGSQRQEEPLRLGPIQLRHIDASLAFYRRTTGPQCSAGYALALYMAAVRSQTHALTEDLLIRCRQIFHLAVECVATQSVQGESMLANTMDRSS